MAVEVEDVVFEENPLEDFAVWVGDTLGIEKKKPKVWEMNENGVNAAGVTVVYTGPDKELAESDTNVAAMAKANARKNNLIGETSATIDVDTGKITIKAPKGIAESETFKEAIQEDVLKQASQAYKLNKNYKVNYTEYDEKTGKTTETEITIPEYVEKINEALKNIAKNIIDADKLRSYYSYKFNSKAENLTDKQIQMTTDYKNGLIPIPEFVHSLKGFRGIEKYVQNGYIKEEDLKKFYNRDNFGREELAGTDAAIRASLENGTWNKEEYYEGEDGEQILDRYNANEMAKAIAFRNYIIANDPEGSWIQSVGDNLYSLGMNALYGADRVFLNIANVGQKVVTFGQGTEVQNYIKSMDSAYNTLNEQQMLVNDATAITSWLGQIGGSIAGSLMVGRLGGAVLDKTSSAISGAFVNSYNTTMANAMEAANIAKGSAAASALTQSSIMAMAVENGFEIAKGAAFVLKMMPFVAKVNLVTNLASAFMNNHSTLSYATKFLMDTFHDALVFDSTTLFDALQSSDQDTRNYWMGQLVDNGKWWLGTAGARNMVKMSGKTTLGKWLNAHLTKNVNKFEAWAGNKWINFKDRVNGGSLVQKLQTKLDEAIAENKPRRAKRLKNKVQQLEFDAQLRSAREQLGKIELERKPFSLKFTDETTANYLEKTNAVRALNISVDTYNRGVDFKRQEMLGMIAKDPYTGMKNLYINPGLGGANAKVSEFYFELARLNNAAGLGHGPNGSWISQDVINYLVGQYEARRYAGLSGKGAEDAAAQAAKNLEIYASRIPENIKEFIDNNKDIYASFYSELNQYGIAKKLLDKNRIEGYNNETWNNIGGYMPVIKLVDSAERGNVRIDTGGDIAAIIDQEMRELTYKVDEVPNYVDPELTRQSRINRIAQAEINRSMLDNYVANTGAAFSTFITGEETEYARKITEGRRVVKKAIDEASINFVEDFPVNLTEASKIPKKSTRPVSLAKRSKIVDNMTFADTSDALTELGVIYSGDQYLTNGVDADNFDDWYRNSLNDNARNYVDRMLADYGGTDFKNLKIAMFNNGYDFEYGLRRAYLTGSEEFAKSGMMKDAAKRYRTGRNAFANGVFVAKARSILEAIPWKDTDNYVLDLFDTFENATDDFIDRLSKHAGIRSAVSTMVGSDAADVEVEHYLLKRLQKNSGDVHASLEQQIRDMVKGADMSSDDVELLVKASKELFDDYLTSRINEDALVIKDSGRQPIDPQEAYEKAKEINDKIMLAQKEVDVRYSSTGAIMYVDAAGRQAFATVDPAFASLYNRRIIIEGGDASALAKINAVMSKTFRYGTTSVNLSSAGNQLFRDFGNAVMVGGCWQTIKSYASEMEDVFGKRIVEQIQRFDPSGYEMKQLTALAEKMGVTKEKAAISRELMRGAAIAPSSTERTLYARLWKDLKNDSNIKLDSMYNKSKEILKKYNPDELINGTRENYLRNRVYAANFNDALKSGYDVKQARILAEFTMNNATTNFGRQLYHLQSIAESTPYFRAAINGTKSFWRMWSLDPVGISGRITGGLILPTMYLVGSSLATKENREVYKNIPEYQKEDSLVFVINGEIMSLPMPQEMSSIVAPFRQFVEYLYDSQENDFWELMTNDLLGYLPVDLKGFTSIDMNVMNGDPTILDRMNRGVSRVFSQVAPVPVKTIYMAATGTDPYTGKSMYDPSYWYWDDESGAVQLMDYSQSKFASILAGAGLFGSNAAVCEKVLSGIFGTTGSDILDDLAELFTEGAGKALNTAGENALERVTGPFSVPKYNLIDSQWKAAVRSLTAQKEAIINRPEVKAINSKLAQEKDPEERKKLLAERENYVGDYRKQVTQIARNLAKTGGEFDRLKLAAVVQLLNFNTDAVWQAGSQESSSDSSDLFYSGRDAALSMMSQMGIEGSDDMSVFGYAAKDKEGNIVIKYNTPVTILDLKNTQMGLSDYHLANVKAIVSQDGLYKKHESVSDQISKIYNKKKLTDDDYETIEAIQINWNAEVARALADYISRYSAESAINNKQVRDYLKSYIEVPASWETNNKGKRVYGKTLGDKGSLKDAYYSSWLKSMFGINDPYKGQY